MTTTGLDPQRRAVPDREPPEAGTLIIAALLLLVLGFAGYWIADYAASSGKPWDAVPWFLAAGAAIVVVGIVVYLRRGGS